MSFFGQPSLAAYLPLSAGQNLADVPDKAAALANLGTLNTSDIMMNSVPLGTIIPYWGNTAPLGYLPCSGQTVNSATYPALVTFLGGTTSATIPDLRGEFLRGWDNGRGVDTGRANLSSQAGSALHNVVNSPVSSSTAGAWRNSEFDSIGTTAAYFAVATASSATITYGTVRPRNVSVLYCIKAYGAVVNAATANIGNVLTELSQCTKLTQFGVSLGGSGYQKFPSGLILQWGTLIDGAADATDIALPIAFPTALVEVIPTVRASLVNTSLVSAYWDSSLSTTTTVRIGRRFVNNGGAVGLATQGIQYIAIGY